MCDRRFFLQIAATCLAASSSVAVAQIFPNTDQLTVKKKINGCGISDFIGGSYSVVDSSGISELDQGFQIERQVLNNVFKVSPDFAFIDDKQTPQAFAEKTNDGARIFFGETLAQNERQMNPEFWETAVIGIMAHEWAHAFQYNSGLEELKFIQECHADYMAGWYLGLKYRIVNPDGFARSLYQKPGDNRTGFFDPNNYGSPEQRVAFMMAGFKAGKTAASGTTKPLIWDAANEGYRAVSAIVR